MAPLQASPRSNQCWSELGRDDPICVVTRVICHDFTKPERELQSLSRSGTAPKKGMSSALQLVNKNAGSL